MTVKLASHFYAMIDAAGGHEPRALAEVYLDTGVKVMQLRMKDTPGRELLAAARAIAELSRARGVTFIINDRVDIALLAGADGVHLGQNDLPLAAARKLVGAKMLIGISTHTIEQARVAEAGGANYVGFGPMYSGGLKEIVTGQGIEMLRAVRAAVRIPVVAIGGITETRLPEVLAAGADAAAIITDVVRARDVAAKVDSILKLVP